VDAPDRMAVDEADSASDDVSDDPVVDLGDIPRKRRKKWPRVAFAVPPGTETDTILPTLQELTVSLLLPLTSDRSSDRYKALCRDRLRDVCVNTIAHRFPTLLSAAFFEELNPRACATIVKKAIKRHARLKKKLRKDMESNPHNARVQAISLALAADRVTQRQGHSLRHDISGRERDHIDRYGTH